METSFEIFLSVVIIGQYQIQQKISFFLQTSYTCHF